MSDGVPAYSSVRQDFALSVVLCPVRKANHLEKALACALLLHAGALLAFGRVTNRPPLPAAPSDETLEVHLEETSAGQDPGVAPPLAPTNVPSVPQRKELAVRPVVVGSAEGIARAAALGPGGVAIAPSAQRAEVAPGSSAEPWTFSPTVAEGVWLGLRATPDAPSSLPGSPGRREGDPGREASAASTTAVADSLRAALDAHDRSIGLGSGAPLVEPTREAVRTSLVPDFARAILEFTTDRAGLVVSVRVVDASSDRQAWDEVADKLARDTQKKPLRMPPGARGVAVTMQVESKVLNASGQDPGQGVLSRAAAGLFEPTELLMDSNAKPRRVVVAKVLSELRL